VVPHIAARETHQRWQRRRTSSTRTAVAPACAFESPYPQKISLENK
jgi:hypothetical protein